MESRIEAYSNSAELDYGMGRARQPVLMKRPQLYFVIALVLLDISSTFLAYYLGHAILFRRLPAGQLGPFQEFILLPIVHSVVLVAILFSQQMYQRRRTNSHLDEFFRAVLYLSLIHI